MSVSTARSTVEVECGECGRPRWVSPERATRIARGVVSDRCRRCKHLASAALPSPGALMTSAVQRADFGDDDIRWWLARFGAPIESTEAPRPWIAVHGMPDELHAIVASIRPPR